MSGKINNKPLFPLFIISFLLFLLLNIHLFNVHAEGPKEDYKKIQRDIKKHKKKLESVKKQEQSVIFELKKVDSDLNEIEKRLKIQREKITKIKSNISSLETEIDKNKAALSLQNNLLKKRLIALQKIYKINDEILALTSGADISQITRIIRYLKELSAYDRAIIDRYKDIVITLNIKQEELKRSFLELKKEEGNLTKLENELKEKKKERESLLASVRKEKKHYENMIKELEEASQRLFNIIQESERRERELSKKRRLTPGPGKKEEPIQEESGFGSLKGKLPWPVNGTIAIQYGTQIDPLFNLPIFRSGIHIKTSNKSPVRAVHEGKIVFADEFKGYGQLVIISHDGGYHTLYGNLARIFSSNGVIINKGDIIGEAGESTMLGTSGIYFEVRYKGKPLDPQQWLKK